MAQIHILDAVTVNQIAAGEVVERPASVAKELIENALDANATHIEIEIAEGGARYLRVTDDGNGMTAEDAALAFVRHATSKIQKAADIFAISSMGFRGEALASIASVAKVTLVTRTQEAEIGQEIRIEGGELISSQTIGAPVGTTLEVRDLFYNTPARQKFLKTERTESSRINTLVGKLALAHPQIALRLINNGRTVIDTPGNGDMLDTFASLFGTDLANAMLPVEYQTETDSVTGYIAKPAVLKSSRQWQTWIVNGRIVESPALSRALDNAYHSLLPKRGYPPAVIRVMISPADVDVNIHPQKREVKFSDEQVVFRAVYHAVLNALTSVDDAATVATEVTQAPLGMQRHTAALQSESAPAQNEFTLADKKTDFELRQGVLESTVRPPHAVTKPSASVVSAESTQTATSYAPPRWSVAEENTFSEYMAKVQQDDTSDEEERILFTPQEDAEAALVPLGQIANCFIVCQKGEELYIIDQHAAHERVRYDRLAQATEGIPAQTLLVPQLLQLDAEDVQALLAHEEQLHALGFQFEQAGPQLLRLVAAPADAVGTEQERMLSEISLALQADTPPTAEQLRHRVLAYASCRGAIKAGHTLNIRQMRELIRDLLATKRPFVCPHGRPVMVRFTAADLAKLFRRS